MKRITYISRPSLPMTDSEVPKFIGDCVMACFPPDLADNALRACLCIINALQEQRDSAGLASPLRFLRCGFGLAQGMVIEGNMGSAAKTDYTIIGDAVNTASRLEAMTRTIRKSVVLCEKIRNSLSSDWKLVSIGKLQLKGKENAIEIFYPEHELIGDFADSPAALFDSMNG